jgi:hypothetical protein
MNLKSYKQAETAAREGKWYALDGAEFLIASIASPAFERAAARYRRQFGLKDDKPDPVIGRKVTIHALADAVLLDWKNLEEEEGKPLPYSRENAIKVLEVRQIADWVFDRSRDVADDVRQEGDASAAKLKSGALVAPEVR